MKKYRYTGPFSGVTLIHECKEIEKILNPETIIEFPPEHSYTKTLIARGHLTLVEPEPETIEPGLEPVDKKGVKSNG